MPPKAATKKAVSQLSKQADSVIKNAERAMLKGQIVDGVTLSAFDYDVFPENVEVEVEITEITHKDLKRGINTATGKPWEIFQPVVLGVVDGNDVEAPVSIIVIQTILEDNLDSITVRHTLSERNGKSIHKLELV
jgi:hypothetical protein